MALSTPLLHPVVLAPNASSSTPNSASALPPQAMDVFSHLPVPPGVRDRDDFITTVMRNPMLGAAQAQASAPPGYANVETYLRMTSSGQQDYADINAVIMRGLGKSAALERGVVGPTGGSSLINMSILGPIFGIYGLIMGGRIFANAANAAWYLDDVNRSIADSEAELRTLHDQARTDPNLTATARNLADRVNAMRAYRNGVQLARREQGFNLTMPGVVQLSASALIFVYGIDLLGGHVFPTAATVTLGIVAPSVLGAYAAGSLVKNLYDLSKLLRTHKLPVDLNDDKVMQDFANAYNTGLTEAGAYYGLNSMSWSLYVIGAAGLIAIGAGTHLSSPAMVSLVVIGAFLPIIWDLLWGEKCAPHNAIMPHVDRNFLTTTRRRAEVWELLRFLRKDWKQAMDVILPSLPKSHDDPSTLSLKFWERISIEARFKYFWQLLPGKTGIEHLAKWCSKNWDLVDGPLHEYMTRYTQRELAYAQLKLLEQGVELSVRRDEAKLHQDAKLRVIVERDTRVFYNDMARIQALQGLLVELEHVDPKATRASLANIEAWNRVRLSFLSLQGLAELVLDQSFVRAHPKWFVFREQPGWFTSTKKVFDVHMTPQGLDEMARDFSLQLERDFIVAALNPKRNKYEINAVINLEKTAHQGKQHAITTAENAAAAQAVASTHPVARRAATRAVVRPHSRPAGGRAA